ncbi:ty3-gypsy retrotransposon protein, partial [Tanacetum coccineum]
VADQLRRKGKLIVGNDDVIRQKLVNQFHSSAEGGHSGVLVTNKRLANWNKADLAAYPGLLQPLPIPQKVWEDISMDFIDGLPMSSEKTVIIVLFMDNVYKLHGLPRTIVSDKDKVFTSLFWKSLFKMLKVDLQMSSAYHPQTDGQTEVVNKTLECYLSSTKTTPFEIVYNQTPPQYVAYEAGECRVEAVDETLVARDQAIQLFQFYLKRAQNRMKSMPDKHRSEREFVEGDWVYLKLQTYRQVTLKKCKTSEATIGSFPLCRDDRPIILLKMLLESFMKRFNRGILSLLLILEDKDAVKGKVSIFTVYNWETAKYGKINYIGDINYLRFFEIKFPAIVYDDALSSQHVDEVNWKNETSLSEYDIFSVNDLTLDKDNGEDKIGFNCQTIYVNARTKKPQVVPISTRKPIRKANQSTTTPHKKTVTSESTIQKSRSYFRMLYEKTSKTWTWWIKKQCPSGYKWKPESKNANMTTSVNLPLDNTSRLYKSSYSSSTLDARSA